MYRVTEMGYRGPELVVVVGWPMPQPYTGDIAERCTTAKVLIRLGATSGGAA
ncbi:MAG: hypothetical protein ACRCY8_17355 [Dermatophilaceae bacterium]